MDAAINVNFDCLTSLLTRRLVSDEDVTDSLQASFSGILSDLFDLGNKLTQASDWLATAFGAAASATDTGNAFRIAEVLAGVIPPELLSQLTRALDDKVPPNQPPPPPPPSEPPPKNTLKDLLQRLKSVADPTGSTAIQAIATLGGVHDDLLKLVATVTAPKGNKWSPENVVRSIREVILKELKKLTDGSMPGPRTKAVAAEIEAELAGPLEERLFIATGLTGAGFLLYGVDDLRDLLSPPSSGQIGTEIHQVLQIDDRQAAERVQNVIVQESVVYFEGNATPLVKAQFSDVNLYALFMARDSALLKLRQLLANASRDVQASLRDDNIDLALGTEWEIKPIRGAALGVVQEFVYRTLYNFCAALLQDVPKLAPAQIGKTPQSWVTRDHLVGGNRLQWPEIVAKPVRIVGGGVTRMQRKTICLVTVDPLPGLLLYFAYDLPAAVVLVFSKALQQLLNELAKKLRKGFRLVVEGIVVAMLVAAALVLAVALIIAIVEAAAEIAAVVAAIVELLGPILIILGTRASQIIDLLRKIAQQVAPLTSNYGLNVTGANSAGGGGIALRFAVKDGTSPDEVPCTNATFGPLRLQNIPVQLLACLPGIFAIATALSGAVVMKRLQSVADASQAPSV